VKLALAGAALLVLNAALLLLGPAAEAPRAPAGVHPVRIGLVFDVGGRGDKSFNDAAFLGVERARRELGAEVEVIEPSDSADRESGLRLLAARGFDLIIGVGFVFSDDMYRMAGEYPRLHFADIDYAKFDEHGPVAPPPNMVALKFREEEGAYLVGAAAALASRTSVLGFVGGMDIPLIHRFEDGYRAGAERVCPRCRVLAGYAGVTPDAFKNPSRGKELALSLYAQGADVVFHAAGSTGLGVFEAARKTSHLAIGVDADQYREAPGLVLTSMIKRIDVAVFHAARGVADGSFAGGVSVFGLAEGGLDYVYDEHNRDLFPPGARERVEALRAELVARKPGAGGEPLR